MRTCRQQGLVDEVALGVAASEALGHAAHRVQRVGSPVRIAALQGQQRAHQRQAHLARHLVVGALCVLRRQGAFGATRQPGLGPPQLASHQQRSHGMHVVEGVVAGLRLLQRPRLDQPARGGLDVLLQQVQPPQPRGGSCCRS